MLVLIDPGVLRTLPRGGLRSGLAECIKHDIIRDAEGFASLKRTSRAALQLDAEYLGELFSTTSQSRPGSSRPTRSSAANGRTLNFGHTFGHAIETVSNYGYSHGECVALGMVAASLANRIGMLDDAPVNRMLALIPQQNFRPAE